MWVQARQYTGRIVTVTNGAVFDEPVYNYSRDFPFIWEELHVMVKYDIDTELAEQLVLDAARAHAMKREDIGPGVMNQLRRRYFVPAEEVNVEPEVFYRLTSNWLELAVRFVVPTHDIRRVKSNISRDLAKAFHANVIEVASTTYAIVDVPPLRFAPATPGEPYPDEQRPRAEEDGSDALTRRPAASGRAAKRPTPSRARRSPRT